MRLRTNSLLTYGWRVIKFLLLLGLLLAPQFAMLIPQYLKDPLIPRDVLMWLLFLITYAIIIVVFVWQFRKAAPDEKILKKFSAVDFNAVLAGIFLMFLVKYAYAILVAQTLETQNDAAIRDMFSISTNMAVMMTLMTAVFAPLCEEILFRGIFMGYFFPRDKVFAVFFSGLIFGLVHFHSGDIFLTLLLYCSLGWILAYYYNKTNNLFVTITIHFLNNFLPAVIMLYSSLAH